MTTKRTIEEWGKRYLVLCVGLWIMSLGVACSIKGALGTSPISSLPYAMSGFLPLTVGTCTIIMHVGFILLQILLPSKLVMRSPNEACIHLPRCILQNV